MLDLSGLFLPRLRLVGTSSFDQFTFQSQLQIIDTPNDRDRPLPAALSRLRPYMSPGLATILGQHLSGYQNDIINSITNMTKEKNEHSRSSSAELSPQVSCPTYDGGKLRASISRLPAEIIRKIIQPVLEEALSEDVDLGSGDGNLHLGYGHSIKLNFEQYSIKRKWSPRISGEDHDDGIKAFRLFENFVTAAARFAILGGAVRDDVFAYNKSQRTVWTTAVDFLEAASVARPRSGDASPALAPRSAVIQLHNSIWAVLADFLKRGPHVPAKDVCLNNARIARDMFRNGIWKGVVCMLRQSAGKGYRVNFAPWDPAFCETIGPQNNYKSVFDWSVRIPQMIAS